MRGRIVYVMGASGAGKDSLLMIMRRLLSGFPVAFSRRYITRPATSGGERHIPVSQSRFEELSSRGYFSLQWTSHGLRYGISSSSDRVLEYGVSLIVNGSRAAFPQAVSRYPDLLPVFVSVPPQILRERLIKRGRERGEELEERLRGACMPVPGKELVTEWINVDNSGNIDDSAHILEKKLKDALHLNTI